MPKITFIEHNGTEHTVEAPEGRSLMQAAVDEGVPGILADCGGCCSCATCHAFVDDRLRDKLPEPQTDERLMLEGLHELRENSRLSCQVTVTAEFEGMIVRLPENQF